MSSEYTRKPYKGSCHCGTVKYIVYLALPPASTPPTKLDLATFHAQSGLKTYKCNCTVCHKMGFFHLRPRHPPADFVLLAPLEASGLPDARLAAYTCNEGQSKWYFCGRCGVRMFTLGGDTEAADVELPARLLREDGGDGLETVRVWRPVEEGWAERDSYLSVNFTTVDGGQGVDLRRLHEWGVVEYCNTLFNGDDWEGAPYEGGMY